MSNTFACCRTTACSAAQPRELIIKQGQRVHDDSGFYTVLSGEIEVFVKRGDSREELGERVGVLGEGDTFGEKGLLEKHATRAASCVAASEGAELLELTKVLACVCLALHLPCCAWARRNTLHMRADVGHQRRVAGQCVVLTCTFCERTSACSVSQEDFRSIVHASTNVVFSPAMCLRILQKPGNSRTRPDVTLLAGTISRFHVFATLPQDALCKLCKYLRHARYPRGSISASPPPLAHTHPPLPPPRFSPVRPAPTTWRIAMTSVRV